MRSTAPALGVALLGAAIIASPAGSQSDPPHGSPWPGCCGAATWPQRGGMMGGGYGGMMGSGGMMGGRGMMGGSATRNHAAMMGGLPPDYAKARNPLPQTSATVQRGAKVYTASCASCHGPTGYGDGPAASGLNPRPANLAWLSRMPMSRWDPFMFWTVSEGGAPFGTAMPSFKTSLSEADRWAVIAYIQASLPATKSR